MTAAIALPQRQRTPEWFSARKDGIGSSDAPVIAGVSPWGDIRTLFAEKVGWTAPVVETAPLRWGRLLEAVVAGAYAKDTGRKLRRVNRLLRHPDLDWMLASLDRVFVGERRLVEIKIVRFIDEQWGRAGSDEVPDHVRIQVEHQMAVTGYDDADVVALFSGNDLRPYHIHTDPEIRADLVDLEAAFWRAVQAKSLPTELVDLAPRPVPLREGEVAASDIEAPIPLLTNQVAGLRRDAKVIEAAKERAEAQLKAAIDEYTAIRGDHFRISYRPSKDSQTVAWEQVAGAYRKALEQLIEGDESGRVWTAVGGPDGLAAVESLFTTTKPGARPLRITMKEPSDDVPL